MTCLNNPPLYQDDSEINQKIQENITMSDTEKYILLQNLQNLDRPDQLQVVKFLIQEKYTENLNYNDTSTMFDLNDLPRDALWKLQKFTDYSIKNAQRAQQMQEALQADQENQRNFKQRLEEEYTQSVHQGVITPRSHLAGQLEPDKELYTPDTLPSYETLRDQALFYSNEIKAEKVKATQMSHMNLIQEIEKKEREEISTKQEVVNNFFRPRGKVHSDSEEETNHMSEKAEAKVHPETTENTNSEVSEESNQDTANNTNSLAPDDESEASEIIFMDDEE